MEIKKNLNAVIFGIAIIVSAIFLGNAYAKRYKKTGEISVTGLGKKEFNSDLIIWGGTFDAFNSDLKLAYQDLEDKKEVIQQFLIRKGLKKEDFVFKAANSERRDKSLYTADGKYIGSEFVGYNISQSLYIESKEVKKIQKLSREISELLNEGVDFQSDAPRYYYTKLSDLKIEMISKATENARIRVEQIAKNSGGEMGDLLSAKMGVFQITGQNSEEDYSWGGAFNTSSYRKTASITMKLVYSTE